MGQASLITIANQRGLTPLIPSSGGRQGELDPDQF